MKIAILVEGRTEQAFKPHLIAFLKGRLADRMPNLDFFPQDGRIAKGDKLRRVVENLLRNGTKPADAVIALTDVYTGTNDFKDAAEAKRKMREWVGSNDKFYPHAAQHDFEAWLFRFGTIFKSSQGTMAKLPQGDLNRLTTISRLLITSVKSSELALAKETIPNHVMLTAY